MKRYTLQSRPVAGLSDNREHCEAPKLGGQRSKSRSQERPFIEDIRKRNTSFTILTSFRNIKISNYFKILTKQIPEETTNALTIAASNIT